MPSGGAIAIYFADPMCSWCWGFAPSIRAIRDRYGHGLPIRLVMGGLRPGTDQPMTEAARQEVRHHWEHVQQASGQPFDFGFFDRETFVYDTDPAARAVVAVRREDPLLEASFFDRVQRAFYAENQDVTQPQTLADLAAEQGLDRDLFLARLASEEVRQETWQDYQLSQQAGIRGFPTLLVGPNADGAYVLVTHGYRGPRDLMPALQEVVKRLRSEAAGAA